MIIIQVILVMFMLISIIIISIIIIIIIVSMIVLIINDLARLGGCGPPLPRGPARRGATLKSLLLLL